MKDGDPQQRNEIQAAMKNIFINASEGTCGFHVVNMGWKKHVPTCTGIFTPLQLKKWSSIVSWIHNWIYSWMNPGNVEDEDEYKIFNFIPRKVHMFSSCFGCSWRLSICSHKDYSILTKTCLYTENALPTLHAK
jgi:hypothetical protein